MTYQEIIELEQSATSQLRLHRKGIFYRVYHRSAMWWVNNIQSEKDKWQVYLLGIKHLGVILPYLSFPVAGWPKYQQQLLLLGNSRFEFATDEVAGLGFEGLLLPSPGEYERWLKQMVQQHVPMPAVEMHPTPDRRQRPLLNNKVCTSIAMRIWQFPLEGITPMQAMQFLAELKEQLR